MAPVRSAPSVLKGYILFLVAGTCLATTAVLLFDNRLYTGREVVALFGTLLLYFLVQAFTGGRQQFLPSQNGLLFYAQSFVLCALLFGLLYGLVMPFPPDVVLTLKLVLLCTLVETSLHFFVRYQRQLHRNKDQERRISQSVRQQQVKELEVLKQQIDPHFIFNSFNTLGYLIDENSEKAKRFSHKLANVYRYIIFNSSKNLVSLEDEIGFARDYAYLQEIRHADEVCFEFVVPQGIENVFVLPVSLQLLLENAVKHNTFSEASPLSIRIVFENGALAVENNLQPRTQRLPSSKIGLTNLRDRCRLIIGKDLQVVQTESLFRVVLPLLRQ